ncbi:ROK family transcriptional regulator [Actinokineospora inagensis]|uniref:ROK family transcriptional regulator n=1 Tax=Actinokineospora inagensis TaxID=103730 RepID=UPI00040A46FC|nr:ROK family transcriptional regulator [Actinokineospora inagensis]
MVPGDVARSRVLAAILSAESISRAQLAERTGLSTSRITKVVAPLVAAGLVEDGALVTAGPGRPRRMLRARLGQRAVVGIKLSPRGATGVLTDMGSQVLARAERTLDQPSPDDAIEAMREICAELTGRVPITRVGVGLSGHVDGDSGTCVWSAILGWRDVAIADRLSAAVELPVVVNNDVNALAVAQRWFGAGRDVRSFAVVTFGLSVGCGLVFDNQLHTGSTGMAGELGHIPLVADGPLCTCGKYGCLEAVASFPAIVRALQEKGLACRSIVRAMRMARSGNEDALAVFADAGTALGRGLATLGNLLDLDKIILSGEGVRTRDLVEPALRAAWRTHSMPSAADHCELVFVEVDHDMWATGAACLAIQSVVSSPTFEHGS